MELVDDEYESKMAGFEIDCNDGKGDPTACHHVAEFYSVVKDDWARAAKVYEGNCESKDYPASCFNLAKLYLAGKGQLQQSDAKAQSLFDKACKGGHLHGCYHQGLLMFSNAVNAETAIVTNKTNSSTEAPVPSSSSPSLTPAEFEAQKQQAIAIFDKTCSAGESDSCHFIAGYYLDPKNTAHRHPAKAVDYLTRSCERSNHAPSCFNLAVLYKKGDVGVPADQKKFEHYKATTNALIKSSGRVKGTRTG